MKKLTLLFTFCIAAISMFAQGTITGTMIDKDSGEPIMFANVYIDGNLQKGTETDFDGKFQFQIEAGTYNVVGSYVGYPNKCEMNVNIVVMISPFSIVVTLWPTHIPWQILRHYVRSTVIIPFQLWQWPHQAEI